MKSISRDKAPVNIFYSYAHKDEKSRAELSKYFAPFRRTGAIKEWYDGNIEAGEEFARAINQNIYNSDIILLVITINFLNSDYCWEKEMREALKLHEEGRAKVIPVMVQPISVQIDKLPFGKIKVLPKDGKPVSKWDTRTDGWNDVATTIGDIIENWSSHKKGVKEKPAAAVSTTAETPVKKLPKTKAAAKTSIKTPKQSTSKTAGQAGMPSAQIKSKRTLNKVQRIIYDAQNKDTLPGRVVREEGAPPVGDKIANAVYDNLGKVYDFFHDVYGRHSADNKGMPMGVVIHYSKNFGNIFWDGRNTVIGDGDKVLRNFHELEFLAHDFTYALIQYEAGIEYWGESGSLMVASGHIFGCLAKQYHNKETAQQTSWLFGENALAGGGISRGIFSLSEPGTAYVDHPAFGTDENKFHTRDMQVVAKDKVSWENDQGGIHVNCGIPSRAFYLAAIMIGGYAWEKAGKVWYETLVSKDLAKAPSFSDFARITISIAGRLYKKGSIPDLAFRRAWELVGVDLSKKITKKPTKGPVAKKKSNK